MTEPTSYIDVDVIPRGSVYVTFVYAHGKSSARHCLMGWSHFMAQFGDILPCVNVPVFVRLRGK